VERLALTYKEYWGYYWRVTARHQIPGIFEYDQQLVDLVERACELKPYAEILDLGCGGGDQLKLFARKNYKVTGIDFVPSLIEYARNTFSEAGLPGEFIIDDMRNIGYQNQFALVIMLSGTFGYFDDDNNKKMLGKVHRALKPGGRAFIDYLPVERFASTGYKTEWHEIENGYALSEEWFDALTSTYNSRHRHILLDGKIIEGADKCSNEGLRCHSVKEMENLAESTGFVVTAHLTRNHIGNPEYQAREDEPRGMIVLRKGA